MIIDGKRMGVYHEDGTVCVVEVLADNSDDEWERFELECKRIIRSSRVFKDPEIGERWSVDKTKGEGSAYVSWRLDEESDDARQELEAVS